MTAYGAYGSLSSLSKPQDTILVPIPGTLQATCALLQVKGKQPVVGVSPLFLLCINREGSGISRTSELETSFWKGNRLAAHRGADL